MNLGKTKVVIFRRGGRIGKRDHFFVNGAEIEVVKSYVYLGVVFSSSGLFCEETESRIKKTLGAQMSTLNIIMRNKIVNPDSINSIFDSMVQSVLLYGAAVWSLRYLDKIERVQQSFYKRFLNLPRSTPGYFVRLETGRPHTRVKLVVPLLKLWVKLMRSPRGSLL